MVISLTDDIKFINFSMITLISICLIFGICVFFFINKRNLFLKKFKNKNINNNINVENKYSAKRNYIRRNTYKIDNSNLSYSRFQKKDLRRKMKALFKGSKADKIKALEIAGNLSDRSILPLLKIGLKDMDSDIVKISANLIQKFK